jgi:hypothetical protein
MESSTKLRNKMQGVGVGWWLEGGRLWGRHLSGNTKNTPEPQTSKQYLIPWPMATSSPPISETRYHLWHFLLLEWTIFRLDRLPNKFFLLNILWCSVVLKLADPSAQVNDWIPVLHVLWHTEQQECRWIMPSGILRCGGKVVELSEVCPSKRRCLPCGTA